MCMLLEVAAAVAAVCAGALVLPVCDCGHTCRFAAIAHRLFASRHLYR